MEALVTGTSVVSHSSALTGAITGTPFAVPIRSQGAVNPLTIQMVFASAPGASEYNLMGSLDGVNFTQIGTDLTDAILILQLSINVKFVRLDQVSKTNAVQSTGSIMLG